MSSLESNIIEAKEDIKILEDKWTNVQLDSQVLSTFMSCPRKADFVFNRHLVPITGVSQAIEKGQLAHIGLHAYWKARIEGKDYQAASIEGINVAKREALRFANLNIDHALECYANLVEFFKFISNSPWIPVFVEQHFKFIAYEDPKLKLRIILTGRIDLGLKTPTIPLIPIDNKSESERWFYTQMSNQFKIYALACGVNTLGVQRFGFQKTLKPEDKFKLELLPFDQDYLDEFRYEVLPYYCKQLLMCQSEGYWPPNYASCVHGHFACQFSDKYNKGICNVSRNVREQKLSAYFTIGQPWDPKDF